jgi:hypothetical protein
MKNICRNKNKEGFDYEEKGIIHDAGWRNDSVHAGRMRLQRQTTRQPTQRQRQPEQQKQAGVLQKHPEIR